MAGSAAGDAPPAEFLERVRRREPDALEEFFERYFDRVYALVFRMLGHRTPAEDAAADVVAKALRAIDRLDPLRDPWPWLVSIATNACRDLWRSGAHRMARQALDVDDPAVRATLTAGRNDPEADLEQGERERHVQVALLDLPEDLRTSVLLYDYAGLSHEAIAEQLGITHDAARKRHSRALAALGKRLKDVLR
jgi:RNA polymerase sigma-70 factor (ECF subfamily)